MREFFIRVLISAIAIAITAFLLPGITVASDNVFTLLMVGLVIGLVNAIVKPLLIFLTCPAVLLTLGLFILVINALMLQLAASIVGDALIIDGFGWAFVGGIVMGITTMILEGLLGLGDDDQEGHYKEKN